MAKSKPKPKPPRTLPTVETQRELGEIFGKSGSAVRKWLRHRDWPAAVPKRPPWSQHHVRRIAAFALALHKTNNPKGIKGAAAQTDVDLRLKLAKTRLIRLRIEAEKRLYIPATDAEEWRDSVLGYFIERLASLAQSLPAELSATNPQDWTAILENRFGELCNTLANA